MTLTSTALLHRAGRAKVVPVLTIPDVESALPLAEALVAGGLDVLEVTLRTACALDAIELIRESDVDCLVGAGTIVTPADVVSAETAGSQFLVSPGTTPALAAAMRSFSGPAIPGVSSASEAMARLEDGFDVQKFFPAEASGGATFLKSVAGPLPQISFMPTGGISLEKAPDYLAIKSVSAVGGSWVAPNGLIADKNWSAITELAKDTVSKLSA